MGLFGDAQRWQEAKKAPLPKICHTYPTMMKLGRVIPCLKKSRKYMDREANLLNSDDIGIYSP